MSLSGLIPSDISLTVAIAICYLLIAAAVLVGPPALDGVLRGG